MPLFPHSRTGVIQSDADPIIPLRVNFPVKTVDREVSQTVWLFQPMDIAGSSTVYFPA
jgi:hypothetical protein